MTPPTVPTIAVETEIDLRTAARELVNLVRSPSGDLQDDVAICLIRPVE